MTHKTTKTGVLRFDLSDADAARDFRRAVNADGYARALGEIHNEIFRPARKHGYPERELRDLDDKTIDVIGELESKFFAILKECGVTLED